MDLWYSILDVFPFDWTHYVFMKNALLAVLLISPLFALLGTMVVSSRMAFFSDVLGHSALTGIALGVLLGLPDPLWAMVLFMAGLAFVVNYFKRATDASFDTVLGVFFAVVVALGVVILSRGGGFAKYTSYLIGDILTVSPEQIGRFILLFVLVLGFWFALGNQIFLISINPFLARSRKVPVFLLQTLFTVLLAVVVALSSRLVGILMINSLLILPAAASRNLARNIQSYTLWAVLASTVSGIAGLILSYYWGTSSGATIVLCSAGIYVVSVIFRRFNRK